MAGLRQNFPLNNQNFELKGVRHSMIYNPKIIDFSISLQKSVLNDLKETPQICCE